MPFKSFMYSYPFWMRTTASSMPEAKDKEQAKLKAENTIRKELQKIAEEQSAFRLSLKETGLFPDMRRPRVVWVGLGDDIKALSQLQSHIDSALTPVGFVSEKRDFTPHLTLARIPEGLKPPELEDFGKQWAAVQINTNLNFMATSVNLMKSTLRSAGAIYDVLASFQLKSS
mgnify:CR=1 FL=1